MNAQRNFQRDHGRGCDRLVVETDDNLDVLCLAIRKEIQKGYNIDSDTLLILFILENRLIYFYYI